MGRPVTLHLMLNVTIIRATSCRNAKRSQYWLLSAVATLMGIVGRYPALYGELVVRDARELFEPGVDVGTDG